MKVMDLIIVESPTKAKTLSRFLEGKYRIEASMGHIRDLPKNKLGIDEEHDFAPQYVIPKDKKARVDELSKLAKESGKVILATDPDREGEAIAWHVASVLGGGKMQDLDRIVFHEITETAIREALSHPRSLDMNLIDAQQARRVLDRLVGYKLSPLLWKKIRRGLSAGRVQSVAVRMIVEREKEIEKFKADEYWEIVARLVPENGETEFEAKLIKKGDSPLEIKSREESEKISQELNGADYEVADVSRKEVKRNPYPPFTTSTLQQAAANLFGWSAKRTMQIAQSLYEQGLITYHRTDSTNLAAEAVTASREYIKGNYGEKYLPGEPRLYKTKSKVAQEAHEAIRPTNLTDISGNKISEREQKRLYELIWKRFLACQMAEAIYEQSGADIKAGEYLFRATGSSRLFDGWQKLFAAPGGKYQEDGEETEQNGLPPLTVAEKLKLLNILPTQHFTVPPPRFTEASLIKALEEYGIGRPSTYAPIISTIMERFYVEKIDKKLQPTSLGTAVNDFLTTNFPEILDFAFTAGMEENLDAIANGEKQWVPVIREFDKPFEEKLGTVAQTAQRVKVETETTDELCPNDGSPLVVRVGRFGKFLACSKFPDCKFTKTFTQKINIKCPKCGGDIIIKRTRTKKTFYGCSNYPKCDYASWTKPKVDENGVAVPQAPKTA